MIEIDFFYRPLGTNDEPRRGKITVGTVRYDEARESYFSHITFTEPINIANEFSGVDPLNTLEGAMIIFHTYMKEAGYQFWRWECSEADEFLFSFPPSKRSWIFVGEGATLPSGVFSMKQLAHDWIAQHGLSGLLTAYPIDDGLIEWATEKGFFKPKDPSHSSAKFVQRFTSAYLEHYHYENGTEVA
jgi:hypothetical protein